MTREKEKGINRASTEYTLSRYFIDSLPVSSCRHIFTRVLHNTSTGVATTSNYTTPVSGPLLPQDRTMADCPTDWSGITLAFLTQAQLQRPDFCTVCDCPLTLDGVQIANMAYRPSLAGNVLFAAIFGVLLAAHIFLGLRYKTRGFMIAMVCGLILEIVGYVGRILMRSHMFDFNYFIMYASPPCSGLLQRLMTRIRGADISFVSRLDRRFSRLPYTSHFRPSSSSTYQRELASDRRPTRTSSSRST